MCVIKNIVVAIGLFTIAISAYSCKKCMTCSDYCCYIEGIDTFFCYKHATIDSSDRTHLDSIVKIYGNCKSNVQRILFKTCDLNENQVKYLEQEGIYCGYSVK